MSDDLVEVKMNPHYPSSKYSGLCGFFISRGERKFCPEDVYKHGESKGALMLVDAKIVEKKKEDKPVDLIKEAKDIVDEGKDFLTKVTRSERGKKKS